MRVPRTSGGTSCSPGHDGLSADRGLSAIGRGRIRFTLLPAVCCVLALGASVRAQEPGLAPEAPAAEQRAEDSFEEAGDPAAAGDVYLEPDRIKQIQQDLKEQGYFFGPADGRKGPRTRTALRNFQRDENLAVTGSLDQPTLDRLGATGTADAREPGLDPVRPVASAQPRREGGPKKVLAAVGGAVTTGVKAVGIAGRETGKATGKAGATVGKSVGKAGTVTASASTTAAKATAIGATAAAKATATAAVVTAKAVSTAAVTVAKVPKTLYDRTRGAVAGESRSDAQIQRSIENQYAEDNRLVPAEIEVRVADRHVTLVVPQDPRSDISHAVRLAKLSPGVESVNVLYNAPPAPIVDQPADEPILLPQTAPPSETAPEPPPDR